MTRTFIFGLWTILMAFIVSTTCSPTGKKNDLLNKIKEDVESLITKSEEIKSKLDEENVEDGPNEEEIDQKAGIINEMKTPPPNNDIRDQNQPLTETEVNTMNNFQGDELIIPESRKRGVPTYVTKWPRVNGILRIPYEISSRYKSQEKAAIAKYIGNMNTYLKGCNTNGQDVWRTRTNSDAHYALFIPGGGCSSYLGKYKRYRLSGKTYQPITLAPPTCTGCGHCLFNGIVLHEMMHAMGFEHEQTRPDRDSFVKILIENIQPNAVGNFRKETAMHIETTTPYDYGSIMHYSASSFPKRRGQQTIVQLKNGPGIPTIGQREGMSATDIKEVTDFYQCTGSPPPTPTTKPPVVTTPSTTQSPGTPSVIADCSFVERSICPSVRITGFAAAVYKCTDENPSCSSTPFPSNFCESGLFREFLNKNCRKTCEICTMDTREMRMTKTWGSFRVSLSKKQLQELNACNPNKDTEYCLQAKYRRSSDEAPRLRAYIRTYLTSGTPRNQIHSPTRPKVGLSGEVKMDMTARCADYNSIFLRPLRLGRVSGELAITSLKLTTGRCN